ncbi:UNVERIFIED_CONTAM: hypothetical protein FKN15_017801 [Acipenser sinensis]
MVILCNTSTVYERMGGPQHIHYYVSTMSFIGSFNSRCRYSHDLRSGHNNQVLKANQLQGLEKAELFLLLTQNDPSLLPKFPVCAHYNKGSGEHGSCTFKTSCKKLHMCQHFLQGDCRFMSSCKRSHKITAHAEGILLGRGLSDDFVYQLPSIYINSNNINNYRASCREEAAQGCRCGAVNYLLLFIHGLAASSFRGKVATATSYLRHCGGSPAVDFLTMRRGSASVRRLSTVSSVTKPPHFILTTDWAWYWRNEHGKWVEYGNQRVPLSPDKEEFRQVQGSFQQTLPSVTIEKIERIQNPSLWEVFQWQKEQMKMRSGGSSVDERFLFHGTDKAIVDTICEENFDWRICGVHGTLYGNGSYFARDAKYSHHYTGSSSSRAMFVTRVLVGDFVQGHPEYLRPPSRDGTTSNFYDSCVDNPHDPSIFVVFEKDQVYPEYLIQYRPRSNQGAPNQPVVSATTPPPAFSTPASNPQPPLPPPASSSKESQCTIL